MPDGRAIQCRVHGDEERDQEGGTGAARVGAQLAPAMAGGRLGGGLRTGADPRRDLQPTTRLRATTGAPRRARSARTRSSRSRALLPGTAARPGRGPPTAPAVPAPSRARSDTPTRSPHLRTPAPSTRTTPRIRSRSLRRTAHHRGRRPRQHQREERRQPHREAFLTPPPARARWSA